MTGMSMPTASPFASNGWLYVGTGSQGDANRPFLAIKPGAVRRHHAEPTARRATTSSSWRSPRASGYTPSALVHDGRAYLVHDTGILAVLNAKTGEQIYKVRVGGGGHTFSASPVARGQSRLLADRRAASTFVLESGDRVQGDRAETISTRCRWRRRPSPAARSTSGPRRSCTRLVDRQAQGSRLRAQGLPRTFDDVLEALA